MSVSRNTVRGPSKTRYLARRIKRRGVEGCVKRGTARRWRALQAKWRGEGW